MKDFTSLLVVYEEKDEEIFRQLKSFIEREDDLGTENYVGTEDGTVKVIKCPESMWYKHKKAGNEKKLADKFLFIDDIKDIETPEFTFSKYGVGYGIHTKGYIQICVDDEYVWTREEYDVFLEELKADIDNIAADKDVMKKQEKKKLNNTQKVLFGAGSVLFPPLLLVASAIKIKDAFNDKELLRKQMLLYGIMKLYYMDLDRFIKMK